LEAFDVLKGTGKEKSSFLFHFNQRKGKKSPHNFAEIDLVTCCVCKPVWRTRPSLQILEQTVPDVVVVETGPELKHPCGSYILLFDEVVRDSPCGNDATLWIFAYRVLIAYELHPSRIV